MKIRDVILTEIFDSNVSGTLVRATADLFTTEATIGDRKIVFNAAELGKNTWEIEFFERHRGSMTYGKTGSGSEMQVFSFIIESINELISRYHPDEITFSSHKADGNRSALYSRIIGKIKVQGYHLSEIVSDQNADIFHIVRDDINL
jgi:hypothetical protein